MTIATTTKLLFFYDRVLKLKKFPLSPRGSGSHSAAVSFVAPALGSGNATPPPGTLLSLISGFLLYSLISQLFHYKYKTFSSMKFPLFVIP